MYLSWSVCYYVPCIYSHARCLCVCVCACVCVCLCLCVRLCVSCVQDPSGVPVPQGPQGARTRQRPLQVVGGDPGGGGGLHGSVDRRQTSTIWRTGTKLIKTAMTPDRLKLRALQVPPGGTTPLNWVSPLFCCGGE